MAEFSAKGRPGVQLIDLASQERLAIAGIHLGFPGIGNVAKRGNEYDFIPVRWQQDL